MPRYAARLAVALAVAAACRSVRGPAQDLERGRGVGAFAGVSQCRPQPVRSPSRDVERDEEEPDAPQAGEEREFSALKMKFCWCRSGSFRMGSPVVEEGRYDDEGQVDVRMTHGFWLGKCEVTQGEWLRVMGTAPWKGDGYVKEGDDYPATFVSWEDAAYDETGEKGDGFCRRLTELEQGAGRLPAGWRYDLPTEAQWEYACRAESQTAYSFGDDESRLSDYAWWGAVFGSDRTELHAHPVGQKKPNAWGLHDMHGNVWEWCRDSYQPNLPGGDDPCVRREGVRRMNRGGGWFSKPVDCRSAIRGDFSASHRNSYLGFRVALIAEGG